MNTKHILIAALLAGAFAPAIANTAPMQLQIAAFDSLDADDHGGPAEAGQREIKRDRFIIGPNIGHMPHMDHESFGGAVVQMHGKVVKNAPYSAEVVSEQQQNLSDGNQIVNKSSSMSYRDSAGRTRQEIRDAGGVLRTVTINDPVEGTTYILHPEAKTATKIGPRGEIARIARDKARDEMRREMRTEARDEIRKEMRREMRKDGDERIIVKRIERAERPERPLDGEARQKIREEVRIRVAKDMADGPQMAGMERIGPMIAGAFGDRKWSSKATLKELGTKEIDGIKAQGKVKGYEIPAAESWYAPDLQVTLMTKRSDPRTGERTWRMSNIKRDEPAAALFTVPSDYAVKDVMAQMKKIEKVEKK